LRDDRAALLINVVDDYKIIIIQPRNWEHSELACLETTIENAPSKLQTLSKRAVLTKWPEIAKMDSDQLAKANLPNNLFPTKSF
jgi:hypothetical protein